MPLSDIDTPDVAFWVSLNHPRFARRNAGRNDDGLKELISQSFNYIFASFLSTRVSISRLARTALRGCTGRQARRRERLRDYSHGRVCWRIPRKDSASGDRAEIQDVDMPPRVAVARSCTCGRTAIGIAD